MADLMTTEEVADLLGVTREWVRRLAAEVTNFPEPVMIRPRFTVWDRAQIEPWARAHGYPRT